MPDPTNELGAISPLLARLALAGETVAFDALFAPDHRRPTGGPTAWRLSHAGQRQ